MELSGYVEDPLGERGFPFAVEAIPSTSRVYSPALGMASVSAS